MRKSVKTTKKVRRVSFARRMSAMQRLRDSRKILVGDLRKLFEQKQVDLNNAFYGLARFNILDYGDKNVNRTLEVVRNALNQIYSEILGIPSKKVRKVRKARKAR